MVARGLFEEVAGSACFESLEDAVGIFIDSDHDELNFWELPFEAPDTLDSVESWEVDVRENDVRLILGDAVECFLPIIVEADEIEALGLLDPFGVNRAQRDIVFDNRDGDVVL